MSSNLEDRSSRPLSFTETNFYFSLAQLTSLPAGKREQAREEAGALRKDLKAETDHLERHAIAEEKKDLAVEEALAAQSYLPPNS